MKDVTAYVILDKKGKIILDDDNKGILIFKIKKEAMDVFFPEEEETVQKVRITEA